MKRDSGSAVSMSNGAFSLDRGVVRISGRFAHGATVIFFDEFELVFFKMLERPLLSYFADLYCAGWLSVKDHLVCNNLPKVEPAHY